MKIPKLFKKAAAFVMVAVTALSIMPATAFAAGDIGTISFSHTYDSNGNAMRYNSSANIGGYTAGGTGNYKYRMFVDGENAFCIQPGVPLKTGNTLKKASSSNKGDSTNYSGGCLTSFLLIMTVPIGIVFGVISIIV